MRLSLRTDDCRSDLNFGSCEATNLAPSLSFLKIVVTQIKDSRSINMTYDDITNSPLFDDGNSGSSSCQLSSDDTDLEFQAVEDDTDSEVAKNCKEESLVS